MKWVPLEFVGECDRTIAKKIRDRLTELLGRVAKLNEERADIDRKAEAATQAELTPKTVSELGAVRIARITTWQAEVELRNAYDKWCQDYAPENAASRVKAFENVEDKAADITARLVSIGYVEAPELAQCPGKITRDMILRHPEHIAARNAERDLVEESTRVSESRHRNRDAKERLLQDMERMKQSLATA